MEKTSIVLRRSLDVMSLGRGWQNSFVKQLTAGVGRVKFSPSVNAGV